MEPIESRMLISPSVSSSFDVPLAEVEVVVPGREVLLHVVCVARDVVCMRCLPGSR